MTWYLCLSKVLKYSILIKYILVIYTRFFKKRLNIQSTFNTTSYLLGYEVNMLKCFLSHDKSFLINIGRDSK